MKLKIGMVAGSVWYRGWGEASASSFLLIMVLGVGHWVLGVVAVIALAGEKGFCPGTVVV